MGLDDYYPGYSQLITFVREPLEAQLSLFHYNQRLKEQGKLFRDGEKREFSDDIDAFLIESKPFYHAFFPKEVDIENITDYLSNKFIYVGVMEDFQTSIDQLAERLNKPSISVSHTNHTNRKFEPSEEVVQRFKEKCAFEYRLYEFALENYKAKS